MHQKMLPKYAVLEHFHWKMKSFGFLTLFFVALLFLRSLFYEIESYYGFSSFIGRYRCYKSVQKYGTLVSHLTDDMFSRPLLHHWLHEAELCSHCPQYFESNEWNLAIKKVSVALNASSATSFPSRWSAKDVERQSHFWTESEPKVQDLVIHFPCVGSFGSGGVSVLSVDYILSIAKTVVNLTHVRIISTQGAIMDSLCHRKAHVLFESLANLYPCVVVQLVVDKAISASIVSKHTALTVLDVYRAKHVICSCLNVCVIPALVNPGAVWFPSRCNYPTSVRVSATNTASPRILDSSLLSIRGKQSPRSLAGDDVTVVSSYYKIQSKYNHSESYATWIKNFMSMDFKCVIFVDSQSFALLRFDFPATSRRRYILRSIHQFQTNRWTWREEELLDHEVNIGHNHRLYQIWNEKVFMVADAVKLDPFRTEFFAWVDIGCIRDQSQLQRIKGFPDAARLHNNKISFLQVEPFLATEKENIFSLDSRFQRVNRIGGGHFAGPAHCFLEFRDIYFALISEAKSRGVFAGKDQSLFAFAVLRHPYLLHSVLPLQDPSYDRWMSPQVLWSSAGQGAVGMCPPLHRIGFNNIASLPAAPGYLIHPFPRMNQLYECDALLLILSAPSATAFRDAIREGWLADLQRTDLKFEHMFVIGRDASLPVGARTTESALQWEQEMFHDLLILPFIDTYWNLTVKVTLSLKLASQSSTCRYIFKIDEDMYIRAPRFVTLVRQLPLSVDLVYGGYVYDQVLRKSAVSRDVKNRHHFTKLEYSRPLFDPYAGGPLYFLSTKLAAELPYQFVNVGDEVVPSIYAKRGVLFKLEDVTIGTLVNQVNRATAVTYHHVDNLYPAGRPERTNEPSYVAIIGVKNVEKIRYGHWWFG